MGVKCQRGRLHGLRVCRIVDRKVRENVLAPEKGKRWGVDRPRRFARLVELTAKSFEPDLVMVLFADHIMPKPVVDVFRRLDLPVMLFVQTASSLPSPPRSGHHQWWSRARLCDHSPFAALEGAGTHGAPDHASCTILAAKRKPEFITFINPIPEKGLALVLRLVVEARAASSRGEISPSWNPVGPSKSTEALGIDWQPCSNVEFEPNRKDMRTIYAKTKVLLFPSSWPEAFGMCPVEAQSNGFQFLPQILGALPKR